MTSLGYDKTISQFLPLSSISWNEADRHYRRVHTKFARRVLRGMDHVVSYHINRAEAEYDLNGQWRQRPRAFRFVVLRFEPGRSLEFPPKVSNLIVEDHRVFLRDLRGFGVREQVVLNRLNGQTALRKYLFEFERPAGMSSAEGVAQLDQLVREVGALVDTAFGLRVVLANSVLYEGATEAVDEPAQRPLGVPLPETTKQGFVEFYFDQREWAEQWFAEPDVRRALTGGVWALARGYRVQERCGFDRR